MYDYSLFLPLYSEKKKFSLYLKRLRRMTETKATEKRNYVNNI